VQTRRIPATGLARGKEEERVASQGQRPRKSTSSVLQVARAPRVWSPRKGRQASPSGVRAHERRTRTETRDQKREPSGIAPALSHASGRPVLRGDRDVRQTGSTRHLRSAAPAGAPTPGGLPAWGRTFPLPQRQPVRGPTDLPPKPLRRDRLEETWRHPSTTPLRLGRKGSSSGR
jgi:hypothetical protein